MTKKKLDNIWESITISISKFHKQYHTWIKLSLQLMKLLNYM